MSIPVNLPAAQHDPKLARRFVLQTIARNCASVLLAWMLILFLGLILAARFDVLRNSAVWNWPIMLTVSLILPLLGCTASAIGVAMQQLGALRESGKTLTRDWMATSLSREMPSSFDPLTTFDLCAETLSSVAAGTALGYAGSPAFAHDPFQGKMVLGERRPFWLHGRVEVCVRRDVGSATRVQVQRLPGLPLFVVPGVACQTVETVLSLLRQRLRQRSVAIDTARRARDLERAALSAKLNALQAQVEPHFLFNTLANLKYLIRTDPERAQDMLDSLVGYLRNALPDMRSVSSTLERELALARDYLSLMRVRMGERLRFQIVAPDELLATPVPPAMLISLVENAVKHGLEHASRPGTVTISAHADGASLRLQVRDDGVGLTEQAGQGFGLSNIHERLALLYGERAALTVSAAIEGGVLASLLLPLAERDA